MKMGHFVALLVAFAFVALAPYGGIYLHHCLSRDNPPAHASAPQYEFRYVGEEKFNNVFVTYRFDKLTGNIDRFTYSEYDALKDDSGKITRPQWEGVGMIRLNDGQQVQSPTDESWPILASYREKLRNENSDTNSTHSPDKR